MKKLVGLFLTPLLLTAPAVAVAKPDSSFGRMFAVVAKSSDKGALAALNQQTNQQLADLAQTMLETSAIPNPEGTTGGVTFFGQFIDHDLTLDTAPQPTEAVDVGPSRTPALSRSTWTRFTVAGQSRARSCTTATNSSSALPPIGCHQTCRVIRRLRNSGGAPQRREPHHCPDSSVVPAASQRARSTRACRSTRPATRWSMPTATWC